MFTTRCFIRKNTPELRKKLEELGYQCFKPFAHSHLDIFDAFLTDEYGCATEQLYHIIQREEWGKDLRIDCDTNEKLFLALVALKDDDDYMQWFTNGTEWILCDRQDWMDMYSCLCSGKGKEYMEHLDMFHKASVEELIEHFK